MRHVLLGHEVKCFSFSEIQRMEKFTHGDGKSVFPLERSLEIHQ